MMDFLDLLAAPSEWLLAQPPFVGMTIIGLLLCAALVATGLAIVKLPGARRRSPLWALALLVPGLPVILLWVLAYKQWPQPQH